MKAVIGQRVFVIIPRRTVEDGEWVTDERLLKVEECWVMGIHEWMENTAYAGDDEPDVKSFTTYDLRFYHGSMTGFVGDELYPDFDTVVTEGHKMHGGKLVYDTPLDAGAPFRGGHPQFRTAKNHQIEADLIGLSASF